MVCESPEHGSPRVVHFSHNNHEGFRRLTILSFLSALFGILMSGTMQIQIVPHEGWQNSVQIRNAHVELIFTLDVGPRVMVYQTPGGQNIFKKYAKEMGGSGEKEFVARGGHRVWISPETDVSRVPDNGPVAKYELLPNGVHAEEALPAPWGMRKTLTVTLDENSSKVTVLHRVINESDQPVTAATWGVSMMAPGGVEIIPQPPMGLWPRDLLPERVIVPWTYTDFGDPRYRIGTRFITLRQTADGGPTKLGLFHNQKWVAYLNGSTLFVKCFEAEAGVANYPDFGCNFETYTSEEMLEVETLSPLKTLQPGQAVEHTEVWFLAGNVPPLASLDEQDISDWITPILRRLGVIS